MRIALFHDLPSGGAKRALYELACRLARRHSFELFSHGGPNEQYCDVRPLAGATHTFPFVPSRLLERPFGRINQLQRWRDLWRLHALSRRVAAAIDGGGYDALFAEPSRWTQAPLLLLHTATPSLYHCHELPRALYEVGLNTTNRGLRAAADRVDPLIALYRTTARRLDRAAARAASRALAPSRFIADQLRAHYGISPELLYGGVDTDRFRPDPATPRRREILSVGAVQPSKGFDLLIAALARLPAERRPPLRVVANAESGAERARLKQLAAEQGVALTIEVGIADDALVHRYQQAAIFAYAPQREPFGLAPLEAMACATPVIGVAEGGVMESISDDATGRLVARDAAPLADAIAALLDDPAERQRLGDNGRADVCARWTWDAAADRLEAVLQRVRR